MSNPGNPTPQRSLIARIWTFATTPTSRFSLATLLIVGGIGGILFWGGFNWAMEVANTETFCISCHEMRDNVYKELQQTIHYKNRSVFAPLVPTVMSRTNGFTRSGERSRPPTNFFIKFWAPLIRRKNSNSTALS